MIDNLSTVDVFEWSGSLIGLFGAYMLAIHNRFSAYGWIAFFLANILTICFALSIGKTGLLVQQVGFVGTSLLGIKRSGLIKLRPITLNRSSK